MKTLLKISGVLLAGCMLLLILWLVSGVLFPSLYIGDYEEATIVSYTTKKHYYVTLEDGNIVDGWSKIEPPYKVLATFLDVDYDRDLLQQVRPYLICVKDNDTLLVQGTINYSDENPFWVIGHDYDLYVRYITVASEADTSNIFPGKKILYRDAGEYVQKGARIKTYRMRPFSTRYF